MSKMWLRSIIMSVVLMITVIPAISAVGMAAPAQATTVDAASQPADLKGHWAETTINEWLDKGWLKGYSDGSVRPNSPVKRSELIAMINRAFGIHPENTAKLPFTDLPGTHWAYGDFAAAFDAGYVKGDGGQAFPDRSASRQETAVILAGTGKFDTADASAVAAFADRDQIASWAQGAVAALASKHIFKGDTNGNVRPKDKITRAEAVVAINAAISSIIPVKTFDKPGDYGNSATTETIQGDVVISAAGVTLHNIVITGNLLLAKSIGEGDVHLKQVTVEGTTNVQGGGAHSIHLEDSVFVQIIVNKADGSVRIVASGTTTVKQVVVQSSSIIEESGVTNGGFENIELASQLPAQATIDLVGGFENVYVLATTIKINLNSGTINHIDIASGAGHNTIKVDGNAQIIDLVLNAIADFIGQGKVGAVIANKGAEGSKFEQAPGKIKGDSKDGIEVPATPATVGVQGGNVPSGGSGSEEVDQTNAFLSSMTIGDYTLTKRDTTRKSIGTGFDKDVFSYTIETDRNLNITSVPIIATPEVPSAASVWYSVSYKDVEENLNGTLDNSHRIEINVPPGEDVHVTLAVTSGDGMVYKIYDVHLQYKRTIQEAFKMTNLPNYDSNGIYSPMYELDSDIYEPGDVVNVYRTADKTEELESCTVQAYSYSVCSFDSKHVSFEQTGHLFIQIIRNGSLLEEGDYEYNFNPLPLLPDQGGMEVKLATKAELADKIAVESFYDGAAYLINVMFDSSKWTNGILSQVKHVSYSSSQTIGLYPQMQPPTYDSAKQSIEPYYYASSALSDKQESVGWVYDGKVNDVYVYVTLYDKNWQPLGYFGQAVKMDANHIAEGYVATHNMDPSLNTGDSTPPNLTLINFPSYLGVGDIIELQSDETATCYIVPAGTEESGPEISGKVQAGQGKSVKTTPNSDETVNLETKGLYEGDWKIIAIDDSGNVSESIPVVLSDPSLIALHLVSFSSFVDSVDIRFDLEVQNNLADYNALKAAITISNDNGVSYHPLEANDQVLLFNYNLEVQFETPFIKNGNRIKIDANALKNAEGQILSRVFISPVFKAGTKLTLLSSNSIDAGDAISFKSNKPVTVYLLSSADFTGDWNALVTAGKAKSVVLSPELVDQAISIDTTGLAPGRYYVVSNIMSNILNISISVSKLVQDVQIIRTADSDEIIISSLEAGDVVRLISDPNPGSATVLREVTVQEGETSVSINDYALSPNGGNLYFTLQSLGKAESDAYGTFYLSKP